MKSYEELKRNVEDLNCQVRDLKKIISNLLEWVARGYNPPFNIGQAESLRDLLEREEIDQD